MGKARSKSHMNSLAASGASRGVSSMEHQSSKEPKASFKSVIQRVLPHRYPFLLIDRVTDFTPGVEIRGIKNFSANEEILPGYFSPSPFVPTGVMLEAVTQLGAILVLERPQMAGKIAMILQIPSAHIYRPIVPGDTIRFEARVLKLRETLGALRGLAYLGSELVADGQLRFAIADRAAVLGSGLSHAV
jgi:3-hydroxymyristoyl/3-hydroxydecanoyl-(acyl carrier protein) dehydratase